MTDQRHDETIRAWFGEGPSGGTERGLEDTLARLAATHQARRLEVRLPLWMPAAAVVALLMAGLLLFGAGFRLVAPTGPVTTSALASTTGCRLEVPVGGVHSFIIGTGFKPDTDVTIDITRGDETVITLDRGYSDTLHTDRRGGFGVEVRPYDSDVGREVLVARAGCVATLEIQVVAEDLPPACPDPTDATAPVVDGPAYRAAVAADAPIDWWRLDESGTVAADSAGSHPGTYIGRTVHAARSPLSDGGSTFFDHFLPEGDTLIELGAPVTLTGDFTIEAWAYLCHYVDDGDPIVGSPDSSITFWFAGGIPNLDSGSGQEASGDSPVVAGAWHHWAITRTDGALQIYRDGQPDGWGLDADWHEPFPILLIARNSTDNLRGYLDEVALYDHALSAARVAAHAKP